MTNPTPPWIERFRQKFLGQAPSYHDPVTHANYPAEWKEKMLKIKDVENFITQELARERQAAVLEFVLSKKDWPDLIAAEIKKEREKAKQEGAEEKMREVLKEIEKIHDYGYSGCGAQIKADLKDKLIKK